MSETIEIEIDSSEMRKHIGFVLVQKGHQLRMCGDVETALELETVGRNLIEKEREPENSEKSDFEDSLLDFKDKKLGGV